MKFFSEEETEIILKTNKNNVCIKLSNEWLHFLIVNFPFQSNNNA